MEQMHNFSRDLVSSTGDCTMKEIGSDLFKIQTYPNTSLLDENDLVVRKSSAQILF